MPKRKIKIGTAVTRVNRDPATGGTPKRKAPMKVQPYLPNTATKSRKEQQIGTAGNPPRRKPVTRPSNGKTKGVLKRIMAG